MAEPHTPAQFKDAAKESLKGHQRDLLEVQETAADASCDLEMRKRLQRYPQKVRTGGKMPGLFDFLRK